MKYKAKNPMIIGGSKIEKGQEIGDHFYESLSEKAKKFFTKINAKNGNKEKEAASTASTAGGSKAKG